MADADETRTAQRKAENYDTFSLRTMGETSIRQSSRRILSRAHSSKRIPRITARLIPGTIEDEHTERDFLGNRGEIIDIINEDGSYRVGATRGFRRRLFLFLTEPSSSWLSAIFFFFLIVAIFMSNLIMILQTMSSFQYRPTECKFCEEDGGYYTSFEKGSESVAECVCPLQPIPDLDRLLGYILNFFAVEWTLRVLSFVPADPRSDTMSQLGASLNYLTSTSAIMDALAIWPYYIERVDLPGLISLRLLRLFRVFQLFRLGSYNSMFCSLMTVLRKSVAFLRLMIVILFFGATIFGSLLFWLEQGEWKYWEATGDFQYIRMSIDGITEEISPFGSIPTAFWWYIVTATTVGYGDYYPTSTAGQWVSAFAMLTGVLVIALPVSVFSDLWSEELKEVKGLESLFDDDSIYEQDQNGGSNTDPEQERLKPTGPHVAQSVRSEYQRVIQEDFPSELSTQVVMEREDVIEIVASIRDIHQKQRRIQRILKKYFINEEDQQWGYASMQL
mmetsp:Transcript_18230/g.45288  ORF Transcript_18230/g.45288 Transcript_18230/m.45288 type:complete len:504 (-) Transcript_18230:197-1708(-)|eukprot:CAMPEP_0116087788 /NCGR_PEP_ID=MMETSP0327-20121206/5540_1 /TAXON_ID=44447 /ORGANISM="Pseudo-nitzschia delicatissima, Strain B596" /LENGTH=503 /DNA_ID=CAMNT_0003578859 /DNA_START=28 /DNA_END=1539 /DNA_ORIENTATION=-